jgi:hypothetical protein
VLNSMRPSGFLVVLVLLTLSPGAVRAESGSTARIEELHDEALDAYSNMDMDRAAEILEEAIQLAQREGVRGRLAAQLQLTLGAVLVLGQNRLADGRDRLLAAARESADIEPDPMMSTPLLDQLWQDVLSEARPAATEGAVESSEEPITDEPVTFGQGRVIPILVAEQLPDHAVPIYVEVQQVRDIRRVLLAYRGADQRGFLAIEMEQYHEGYAGRIPCHRVRPPRVEYFITVLDSRGEVIATAGSEEDPFVVSVREELSGREPHLPNAEPEPICSEDDSHQRDDEQSLPARRERLMYVEAGIGTGAGVPFSTGQETNACVVNGEDRRDFIEVNPALAWTELVLTPALGFYLTQRVTLGIRGRLQFAGAVLPEAPHIGGVLAELRFFPVFNDPVRFFIELGLGGGGVVHPISLEGSTVRCGSTYYRESRYFMAQVGAGVLFDVHPAVALFAQLNITFLAPDMSLQGDLTFGLNVSIPRR